MKSLKAWHSPYGGTLHVQFKKWLKLTVFAAAPNPHINDGKPCLEVSVRFFRWYRVFSFDTIPPVAN